MSDSKKRLVCYTTFGTESQELICECGKICYGVTELKLHDVEHKIEELKKQFRYHFGQIWDMIENPSIRSGGLCSDSCLHMDFSKRWSDYQIPTQDKLIFECVWGWRWENFLKEKIRRIKQDAGIMGVKP